MSSVSLNGTVDPMANPEESRLSTKTVHSPRRGFRMAGMNRVNKNIVPAIILLPRVGILGELIQSRCQDIICTVFFILIHEIRVPRIDGLHLTT